MEISKIILWKYGPGTCDFMVRNGELIWEDTNIAKPTNSDLEKWNTEMNTAWEATQYKRSRASEYPSIPDQLDEIYHNGIDSWKAVIKKTKDKYPKG